MIKGKYGKFAKSVFILLRAAVSNMTVIKINGKAVSKGKRKRMEAPCIVIITGSNQMLNNF